MKNWISRFCRCREGSVVIEYTVVAPLLIILTFGIAEFSLVFWQWNAAEKATHLGVRLAATRGPIMVGVPDCGVVTAVRAGTNCRNVAGSDTWVVSCDGSAPGGSCDAARMAEVVAEMQAIFPRIEMETLCLSSGALASDLSVEAHRFRRFRSACRTSPMTSWLSLHSQERHRSICRTSGQH